MQENYVTAGKALKLMFWGTIAATVGAFIPVLGIIAVIGGGLVCLYGLYTAKNAHENYKMALYMEVASLVLSLLGGVVPEGILSGIVSILEAIVSFLIVYYICTATAALLSSKGDQPQADKANLIITLNLVCAVVSIVCLLVSWIPVLNVLAAVATVIIAIVAVVAAVLQLIFYYKSYQSLLA